MRYKNVTLLRQCENVNKKYIYEVEDRRNCRTDEIVERFKLKPFIGVRAGEVPEIVLL